MAGRQKVSFSLESGTQSNLWTSGTGRTVDETCRYDSDLRRTWRSYSTASLSGHRVSPSPCASCTTNVVSTASRLQRPYIRRRCTPIHWEYLGSGPPCYYALSLISAILWGANNSIDTTDKAMLWAGGKQTITENTCRNSKLESIKITWYSWTYQAPYIWTSEFWPF